MTRTAGAEFGTALDRIERELFEADWARARERLGRDPTVSELERIPAQRRHDALVVMARRAMGTAERARLPRPLLSIHVDGPTVFGRLCELADGTPLTSYELLQHLPVAEIERIVHEAPDRVSVSEHTRLFRGAERRAVETRDRYCTFPGCHVPADDCDVDHVVPYSEGGPTRQENGRAVCERHHPGRRRHQPWFAREPDDPPEEDPSRPGGNDTS
jgi:hypothetical protein